MRYVLKVAYDGTAYCGWQVQENGITVQGELTRAAFEAFGKPAVFTASGRTDAGVHAAAQVVHMDTDAQIPAEKVADALNTKLPQDISVLASAAAPGGFDANRSAKKKTYTYSLYFSPRRKPLLERYAVQVRGEGNIDKMKECAALFVGVHDFKAYCASGSSVKTTVREVYSVEVYAEGELIKVDVCGNGFLYNMVRTMVGTIVGYAEGRIEKSAVIKTLEEGERSLVGKTMAAKGLTLSSVDYGIQLF